MLEADCPTKGPNLVSTYDRGGHVVSAITESRQTGLWRRRGSLGVLANLERPDGIHGNAGLVDHELKDIGVDTLQPDFVGCEGMEALPPGVRGDWTGCNGGIAWETEAGAEGSLSIESWDGGQSEYLWIDDVDGKPLVVSLHLGYDTDEDWATRARAVAGSLALG